MENKQQIIETVKRLMAQVNAECFNNALTLNFPIKLSNSGRVAGSVEIRSRTFLGEMNRTVVNMKISKNFNWTEQELKNVVAHELIHVYEAQILKAKPAHGYNFNAKKNEINQNPNYQVTTRHTMESTKEKKVRDVVFVLSADNQKICLLAKTHYYGVQDNIRIEAIFGQGYKCGLISSDKVKSFRVQSKLRYTYKVTMEKLQTMGLS